jgi:hypothetical protein
VRLGYSAGVASSVIVVPVMALETRAVHPRVLGSFLELLRGDARHNSSHGQLDAGDVWRIEGDIGSRVQRGGRSAVLSKDI